MTSHISDEPGPWRQHRADQLGIPAGQQDDYRQLAQTAAILGKGVADLAAAAKFLGAPDPAALGAAGADWDNFSNSGVVLQAWARLVLDTLPTQSAGGLLVLRGAGHQPAGAGHPGWRLPSAP